MTDAERARHAIAFFARLRELSDVESVTLMDRLTGPKLRAVLDEYTAAFVEDVAAELPEDVRGELLEEISSLMLLGYLVRASEEESTALPPGPPAGSA